MATPERRAGTSRSGRPAGLPRWVPWAGVAAVLVLVGAFVLPPLLSPPTGPGGTTPEATASAWTYPTTPPPNTPPPNPTAVQTPQLPTASSLEEFVPEDVDGYDWDSTGEDTGAVDAGAEAATKGTYTSGDETIDSGMAEWADQAAAEADARARFAREFPGEQPIVDGQLRYGAGHFWYFEREGKGTVYWYLGKFSGQFTGTPMDVQEFFLRFPQ